MNRYIVESLKTHSVIDLETKKVVGTCELEAHAHAFADWLNESAKEENVNLMAGKGVGLADLAYAPVLEKRFTRPEMELSDLHYKFEQLHNETFKMQQEMKYTINALRDRNGLVQKHHDQLARLSERVEMLEKHSHAPVKYDVVIPEEIGFSINLLKEVSNKLRQDLDTLQSQLEIHLNNSNDSKL